MKRQKPEKSETEMLSSNDTPPRDAALGRDIQERIGQQLRAMYNDVVSQGVPDRFTELLRKLDERRDEEGKA
jgi:hypothetical protein